MTLSNNSESSSAGSGVQTGLAIFLLIEIVMLSNASAYWIEQVFFQKKQAYLTYLPTLCRGYGCMCMVKELFKRAARSGTPT